MLLLLDMIDFAVVCSTSYTVVVRDGNSSLAGFMFQLQWYSVEYHQQN